MAQSIQSFCNIFLRGLNQPDTLHEPRATTIVAIHK